MITAWKIVFWTSLAILFYTFIGYGVLLWLMSRIKQLLKPLPASDLADNDLPEVTFVIAAYNEEDYIERKIKNSLSFDYPREKFKLLIVTDGSNDRTVEIVQQHPEVILEHRPERMGKIAAVERVMPLISSPVTIYTDANTVVNKDAIRKIVRHYADPGTGGVSGEKRILVGDADDAKGAGEGMYWKYESALKKWDSDLYSVVGAAGELFSIRTELYEHVPKDTIIEDFFLTARIAEKGYRVAYEPEAYAAEAPSASIQEELKRKVRIAAGGFQAISRLPGLLNIFKHGLLSFQYVSHRLVRWAVAPFFLPLLFISNVVLAYFQREPYTYALLAQCAFYLLALLGYILEKQKVKLKGVFLPYYFCVMHYALYAGFFRFLKGKQSVVWEKAKRADAAQPNP